MDSQDSTKEFPAVFIEMWQVRVPIHECVCAAPQVYVCVTPPVLSYTNVTCNSPAYVKFVLFVGHFHDLKRTIPYDVSVDTLLTDYSSHLNLGA